MSEGRVGINFDKRRLTTGQTTEQTTRRATGRTTGQTEVQKIKNPGVGRPLLGPAKLKL